MKFKITFADQSLEFRASAYEQFYDEVCNAPTDDYRFFVDGNQVSREGAFAAVTACREAWLTKKEKTHKQIWVLHGVANLPSNYHAIWVRR